MPSAAGRWVMAVRSDDPSMKRKATSILAASVALSTLGYCGVAGAQLQEKDPLTPVIGNLPVTTRVVIVSDKPSAVLESIRGPWRVIGPLVAGVGSETLHSWGALSHELGYEPREAFDALTSGGLAMVVGDNTDLAGAGAEGKLKIGAGIGGSGVKTVIEADPGAGQRWAVLSVVKSTVAQRVRERLKAAPQGVIGGLPVLSVEEGHFALVCRSLSEKEGSDEVLALTPASDRSFLESIVAAVEATRKPQDAKLAGAGVLSGTVPFATARSKVGDVLVLAAAEPTAGAEQPRWSDASVVTCVMGDRTWVFDVESMRTGPSTQAPLPAECSAWFDAWSGGAAAMVVGGGVDGMLDALAALPGSDGPPKPEGKADGVALCIGRIPGKGDEPTGPGSLWGAVRISGGGNSTTSTLDATGAWLADAIGSDRFAVATVMESGSGKHAKKSTQATDPGVFSMADEMSLRTVAVHVPQGSVLGPLLAAPIAAKSVPASAVWFQTDAPVGEAGGPASRWMVWGIEPGQDQAALNARHRELSGLLKQTGPSERRWLWRGLIRPARVVNLLPLPFSLAVGSAGIGAVRELRVESWIEPAKPAATGVAAVDERPRARVEVGWGPAATNKR